MQQKAVTLINRGMNRDLSISKTGESAAYENHNIRIIARDNDTLLSVTNERGTKEIDLTQDIIGTLIGWNVLTNHIILFTHEDQTDVDRIYRIDYNSGADSEFENTLLHSGNLLFDLAHPIESVVYHETDNIQKIYWVDGKNVLRFMNFMGEAGSWTDTSFDSNRIVDFGVSVEIEKDNSGNTRANGTAQYLLTYYNKHGQESGYVWVSDLVYLSPVGVGGAVDGTNNNRITLRIGHLDPSYSHFRVYSIVRTSFNGQATGYIVHEGRVPEDSTAEAVVIDDGAHLISVDADRFLFLGSQAVIPGTLTHKDQTLFLGDFSSVGRKSYDTLEQAISTMRDSNGITSAITFDWTTGGDNILYVKDTGSYPYNNQLQYTSSDILSFKGGEKYRFALCFRYHDGTMSDAFWIGDAVNNKYPKVDPITGTIQRVVAKCTLPDAVLTAMETAEFDTVQLMIAEATYADRSVKAQGIVCPTVFNVWDRYNKGLYSEASWMMRPRNSKYAYKHFEPIHNSNTKTGEIDCNYWTASEAPTPYYRVDNTDSYYNEQFDGVTDYDYVNIVVGLRYTGALHGFACQMTAALGKTEDTADLYAYPFKAADLAGRPGSEYKPFDIYTGIVTIVGEGDDDYTIKVYHNFSMPDYNGWQDSIKSWIFGFLRQIGLPSYLITDDTIETWLRVAREDHPKETCFFNAKTAGTTYYIRKNADTAELNALNLTLGGGNGWQTINSQQVESGWDYKPSYYKKHLMFVDENVVTLNSPEIEYEALAFDNVDKYKFRIVGVAKITGERSDYVVTAKPGKLPGENLQKDRSPKCIIADALWYEYGLIPRKKEETDPDKDYDFPEDIKDCTSYSYLWGSNVVAYWLRTWNHSGTINGYTDYDNNDYSLLYNKTFANLRYSYSTEFNSSNPVLYDLDDVRLFNYTNSQFVNLNVNGSSRYYDGVIQESLSLPGTHKYPVIYSSGNIDSESNVGEAYMYLSTPILMEYQSSPHAILSLGMTGSVESGSYTQKILPEIAGFSDDEISLPSNQSTANVTGAILPWENNTASGQTKPSTYCQVNQPSFSLPSGSSLQNGDPYVFIGELYYDYGTGAQDSRYGGISESAIKNCRFVTAGPQYTKADLTSSNVIIANQGDTYFQRWDCLKTKPYSTGSVNNVVDITSVLLETHINLDGRSDLLRETKYLASIDAEKYGTLNTAYSQPNNFFVRRDLDSDANLDAYRSTITWTLEKTDSAEIDEWSHVTLASTLKLDGDKGICRALRRFQNSIIAFQDKSISEILFNSRTQIPTGDGVPIELANSGKVDGKRYITNKYGCVNKWSIVEGKAALYFVDNINKAFCSFNGQGIDPISARLGFDVWFKRINSVKPWTPETFENIVSYYDRVHSDVYLVRGSEDEMSCLVFNEKLNNFTSFFDYGYVPMMVNVEDRFVSFFNNSLWLQNEGLYGDFFGEQKDFWVQYRVTPDPFGDKIWSGFDYRADFYHVLDDTGEMVVPEEYIINGDKYGEINDLYLENETFDLFKVWNEYQSTGEVNLFRKNAMDKPVTKDFRIWRRQIPRAEVLGTNRHGLDRIRNPWINLWLKKNQTEDNNQDLMQLHDVVVRYFE